MRKDRLNAKLLRLNAKKAQLAERCAASTDANEVRALSAELDDVNADIADVNAEIAEIEADENMPVTRSATVPTTAQTVNAAVEGVNVGSFNNPQQVGRSNPLESMEYRQAFMNYVQRGVEIPANLMSDINAYRDSLPAEQRAGVPIATPDTAPAIPLTIMRRVTNTLRKRYGNLYAKVDKTQIPGGVEMAIGSLGATFKWVKEGTVSPRQKLNKLGKIQFSYYTAEIRVAQTFLSQLLVMDDFENKIVEVIVVAYMQAMDDGIVNGSGDGQMTGILNDPRVAATGQYVEMTAAQFADWRAWKKNFIAKLPLGYRFGEWIFPMSTVDGYLSTMADANNRPIYREATGLEVNDGDDMNPNGRFFGRDVSIVEPDILPDFDAANDGDVVGIYWDPREYAINENFGFTMRRYFDDETNEWVDKALVVVDGKVKNPYAFWLIKKKA